MVVYASLGGPAIDLQKMPNFAKKIVISDEAHFDLGGYVNKQNCRIWVTENPHAYIEKPTHPKRVTKYLADPVDIFQIKLGTVSDCSRAYSVNKRIFMLIHTDN